MFIVAVDVKPSFLAAKGFTQQLNQMNGSLISSLLSAKTGVIAPAILIGSLVWLQTSTGAIAQSLPSQTAPAAQTQSEQSPTLGVVKSTENATQWRAITDRLDATGLAYRVIEWDSVQRSTQFDDIDVLFLPNIETISSGQLISLQSWLNQGGRLIVSGATGSESSAGVQNALRSLLGAYWAADLSQPQQLQPMQLVNQRWMRGANVDSAIRGGVVVPTSLASEPVAVWERSNQADPEASNSAAVVVTSKTTFLGWHWGDASASVSDLDSSWLRAAVERFQGATQISAAASQPSRSPSTAANSAPSTLPTASTRPSSPSARLSNRPAAQAPIATASPAPNPVASPAPNSAPNRFTRATTRAEVDRLLGQITPAPTPATTSQDPAEQVAAAELDVAQTSRITLYQATTMRQELEALIGRYESAFILANARNNRSVAVNQAAAKTEAASQAESPAPSIDDAVLSQARQGYAAFSQALNQRDYATARQQWLATRQLLWDHFPLDQSLAQSEVRAMWLDRGTIVQAGSRRGLEAIFDRLQAAGINTVFFETVNAGYPIYPSQVAPQQNPLTRQWDPLAEAIDLAHQRGMELHAWVWTFAAGNQMHNAILNQSASYPGPILAAHPDWAGYDNRGSMIPPGQKKPFLDPANPEVRRYLLSLFEEIVSRYDVDGLQLDYIRYPFQDPRVGGHTYGYGNAARQQFQQLTGVDPITLTPSEVGLGLARSPQQQLWQQWTDFRMEQINSFVADTSQLVHRLKPDLILSTAVFALPERQRINDIQQNWEVWAQRGDVDMIVLMSYASDTNGLQRLTNPWLSETADLGSTLILPGIRMLNLSDETILDQIQALRDSSSGGFALFAAENLNSRLQNIFNQTQGENSHSAEEAIPYRQPFDAAVERYQVLLQQWNWLLSNGQLQLSESQLEAWRTKTAAVEQALQALAATPSSQTLQQAKTALASLQGRLASWVNLPTLSEDYRVTTWQHQLATVEKLLDYGERVVLARQNGSQTASTR